MENEINRGREYFSGGAGGIPVGQEKNRKKSALPAAALTIAIIALISAFIPLAGLLLASAAVVIAIVALSRASRGEGKKNIALAAFVVAVIAETAALLISACSGIVIYGFIQESKRQGEFSLDEVAEKIKAGPQYGSSSGKQLQNNIKQSLNSFQTAYQKQTGKTLPLDDAETDEKMNDADAIQLLGLQALLEQAETSNMDPQAMEALASILAQQLGEGDPQLAALQQQLLEISRELAGDGAPEMEDLGNAPNDLSPSAPTITVTEAPQDPAEDEESSAADDEVD